MGTMRKEHLGKHHQKKKNKKRCHHVIFIGVDGSKAENTISHWSLLCFLS